MTAEDLRFRFLSAIKTVAHDRLAAMTQVDHRKTESFLAFAHGSPDIIASAIVACDDALQTAEVAIVFRSEDKHGRVDPD